MAVNPPSAPPPSGPEPGYTTTEFGAITAALVWAVTGTFLSKRGVTSEDLTKWSIEASTAAASVYALARTWRKRATP